MLYLRRDDDDHTSMRAASVDGQSDVRLFADGSTDCPRLRRPALGPDGTIAVVCSPYDEGDDDFLNIMTTKGKLVKRLDVGQIGDPTFSPDGKRLVYARDKYVPYTYGGALFSIPVDGSDAPTRLVTGANLNPVWSPKDDEVVYVHLDGSRRSLSAVRVEADGQAGGTQTLTTGDLRPGPVLVARRVPHRVPTRLEGAAPVRHDVGRGLRAARRAWRGRGHRTGVDRSLTRGPPSRWRGRSCCPRCSAARRSRRRPPPPLTASSSAARRASRS